MNGNICTVFPKQHVCVKGCGVTEVLNISCVPTVAAVLVQLQVSFLSQSNAHFLLHLSFFRLLSSVRIQGFSDALQRRVTFVSQLIKHMHETAFDIVMRKEKWQQEERDR